METKGIVSQAYIGGSWYDAENGDTFQVTDPATSELITNVADCGPSLYMKAVENAHDAYQTWKRRSVKERSDILLEIKKMLLANTEPLAKLLSRENGKPLKEAKVEIIFSATFFDWYASEGRRAYGETIPAPVNGKQLLTVREPLGVAALITPWNFPIGMLARKVAACLATGSTCVVKPAEDTPLVALAFAKLCELAGVPPGVINIIPCSRNKVTEIGELLCTHPKIAALSFTGSTEVGKWLYEKCATTMKKLSMELGGNAPFIVFDDADVDLAVSGLMAAKYRNTGQTCITANRILIQSKIYDSFTEKYFAAVKKLTVGAGLEDKDLGPLINLKQLERAEKIVQESVNKGAKIVYGGKRLTHLGPQFYEPTIVTGITTDMPLYQEEIFGPVAPLIKFTEEDEAIKIANDSERGLAGYAYTNNIKRAWKLTKEIEVGMLGINDPLISTCEAPFGGIKNSGFGYEGSSHGLDEYSHLKYVSFGNL